MKSVAIAILMAAIILDGSISTAFVPGYKFSDLAGYTLLILLVGFILSLVLT